LEAFYSHRLVVALDLARALRFLHQHHIVFRDLKPENLGISLRGHLILVDFGCAKELKEKDLIEHPDGYRASAMVGTVRYMAPEVMKGLPYGLSSDVYAFSLMIWLLFSLEKPFQNARFSSMEDLSKLISEKGIRPQPLPILSDDMQKLIEDCWAANRADRPPLDHICSILRAEIDTTANPTSKRHVFDRTKHIMDISIHSLSQYSD
jgi:serine/threonine protein kinase